MKKHLVSRKIIALLLLMQISCIQDNIPTISLEKSELEPSALILGEIEKRGDFINSDLFPALLEAGEVYSNLSSYLIIDVRSKQDYDQGHIERSNNIDNIELFDYVNNNYDAYSKIIIVSASGQSAAYYTSLFRLFGLKKVYALKFGMASWHNDFANEVLQYSYNGPTGNDTRFILPHDNSNRLPSLSLDINSSTINSAFEARIKELFNEGFQEKPLSSSKSFSHFSINTMSFGYLLNDTNEINYFTMCYGTSDLYADPTGDPGHPVDAVLYYPFFPNSALRSAVDLQSLPPDKPIAIYSYSGHLSAMVLAHLRMLGYNARSILFGGHNGAYSFMKNSISAAKNYTFFNSNNFPYTQ